MPTGIVGRAEESRAISGFLASTANWPAALLLEGEAGIGKTTLWSFGVEHARALGFLVLSARAAAAESVLAYTSLADLLSELDVAVFADLPNPQRIAMDRVLLRGAGDEDEATDPRAVAAGFLSVVERLADESSVLLAIDDLQWLDTSSRNVVAFAARRLVGRVALLGTVRTDPESKAAASWLQLPRTDAIGRIWVAPLSLGNLHVVMSERLGLGLPRPTMVRIHEISGGNPFYALELARTIGHQATTAEMPLPGTLAELVQARIGYADARARETMLAAACVAAPTVELVARVTDSDEDRVVELLEDAESKGIVGIDGQWIRFAHPLLAAGVYAAAAPAQRRAMHRQLAGIVEEPELHARHLALSVTRGDPHTLQALDAGAEKALIRGAPAAAAELLDLATRLGGDTPERRIRLAHHQFNAGDADRARALLNRTIDGNVSGPIRAQALSLLGAIEILDRSLAGAAGLLERALDEAADDLALRVQILVPMSFALYNTGDHAAAARRIDEAVANATQLGQPDLLSQALSMRTLVKFWLGNGLDEKSLRRALELDARRAAVSVVYQPSMHNAILLSCTGHLDEAHDEFSWVRRQCVERGAESDQNFVAFHAVLNEIWRGDFAGATLLAEDAMERALHVGGLHRAAALIMRAHCAAYAGRQHDARGDAGDALATVPRSESIVLTGWAMTILGFLEVSLGNYDAALKALEPVLSTINEAAQATEIYVAACLPDAVEAMIALDRLTDAEPLIDALERNGRRLDRAWMLAVGARCRAMLLAANGDVERACLTAERAMTEHARLPMPFERARTQLLLGQLQRRQREKDISAATLRQALDVFEELDTPLWADRDRAELARVKVGPRKTTLLTPSEQRVAELAASGMTTRDVAARLFVSPKTVEVNITRIYRKLGIRSRAELGRVMSQPNQSATTITRPEQGGADF